MTHVAGDNAAGRMNSYVEGLSWGTGTPDFVMGMKLFPLSLYAGIGEMETSPAC